VSARRGSIGSQQALGRGRRTFDELHVILLRIVDRVTRRMRTADRSGRTVTLRFRFDDFTRATRASSLARPTAATAPLLAVARSLLDEARPMIEERGVTLLGLSVGNLVSADDGVGTQMALPFERVESEALDGALDAVRDRFGSASLTRAATMGSDPEFGVPLLPD